MEGTTVKQVMNFLIAEKYLPESAKIRLPLKKPVGTTTYCYRKVEVEAMIQHCMADSKLTWLGHIIIALCTTGLRISELSQLRWSDLNFERNLICLPDDSRGGRGAAGEVRTTKGHRVRELPIHPQLRSLLETMPHKPEARVFQGPRGGRAKPDSIRVCLIRYVIRPLATKFPALRGGVSFDKGRIHSFRHYFCSMAAQQNIREATLMLWLGHRHSSMIRHYYHLHDEQAQTEMRRLESIIPPISPASTPPAPPATTDLSGGDKTNSTD